MAKAQAIPAPVESQSDWLPYALVVVGIVIGGSAPVLVRLAQLEGIPTPVIVAARLVLSALVLTPFVITRPELRQVRLSDLFYTAIAGIMLTAHFFTLFIAFEHTTILIAGVLSASTPLWVALMEVFVLRTRLNRVVWFGLFLGLFGAVTIALSGLGGGMHVGDDPMLGGILALISAFLAGGYLIAGRKVRTHMSLLIFIWLVFSFGALASLVGVAVTNTPITGYSTQGYLWLIILTIGAQLIAQSAFNYSLAYLSATLISIAGQAVTVVASIVAFFLFNEIPGFLQITGSIVIVVGVIFATLGQTRKRFQPPLETEIPR